MSTVPFLTDLDSRAAIKGSRDPLGIQPIWTRFGRHLVGNLTTVSTSLRDFTTLLLGYHFAERLAADDAGDGDLAVFIKWEQLAAYARAEINNDWAFRGTERVKKNLQEGGRLRLGADSAAQILGNQKIYGLWGLYTVPARSSGLVEGEPTRLTGEGRQLVESVYLPMFTKAGFRDGDAIARRLAETRPALDVRGRDRPLLTAIAQVLKRRVLVAERPVFRNHLLLGGPQDKTQGAQAVLADLLVATVGEPEWQLDPQRIRGLADAARKLGSPGESVARHLERIRTCELLLAPAAALFDFILGSHEQTLSEVAEVVRRHWGPGLGTIDSDATQPLETELREASGDAEGGARWLLLARSFEQGRYEDAIRSLLEQNRAVMAARGGAAPWVDLRDGKLQVRFREEQSPPLPDRRELPAYWRHPYFLESLRAMALALRE